MVRPESPRISVSRRGSTRGEADSTVVWVRGEHDIATKVSLTVAVARAARLDDVPLLLDLAAVTFMDASTVGVIVGGLNLLRSRGRSLEVRAPSPPARRVLELCGLTHLIHPEPIHASGAAPALGTWVDVLPIQLHASADHEAARGAARPTTRLRERVLVAADVHVEEAAGTVEADGGGP